MRIITDIFAYCRDNVPRWNTISVSGYHIREAGSTAVQEIAFTLSNGIAYVQAAIDAGLDVDEFAPRLSFFWNGHNDFFEEVAKFRAARRMWYRIMSERFGAKDEKSKLLRFHTQTAGSMLTAQQPENNIVRVGLQALAAVLGRHAEPAHERLRRGARPARPSRRRRSRCAPSRSSRSSRASPRTPDPLAGSYFVESLTDEVEAEAWGYIEKIDAMGGAVAAIEAGFMQDEIERAAFEWATAVDAEEKVIVGVNRFVDDAEERARRLPDRPRARAAPGRPGAGAAGASATTPRSRPRSRTCAPRPRAPRTCCRR